MPSAAQIAVATAWPGWSAQKTLVLPVAADHWLPPTETLVLDGIRFAPKRELHVTLVGRRIGQALHAGLGERRVRTKAIREAFALLDWRFERSGVWWRLQKNEEVGRANRSIGAIVELMEMPAMARFYQTLSDLLGRELPVPPPHVTLYTSVRAKGIGIPDPATLRRLGVREVTVLELHGLR